MIKFVKGSGNNRQVWEREEGGRLMHEQRRIIKQELGLIR